MYKRMPSAGGKHPMLVFAANVTLTTFLALDAF
jgi:hypothetical protein